MPLKPIDNLLNYSAFFGKEDEWHLCNAVMGAQAGHPLLWDVITGLRKNLREVGDMGMERATGPQYLTKVYMSGVYNVEILPQSAFYPLHHAIIPHGSDYSELGVRLAKEQGSYACHMWGHKTQEGKLGA